MRHLVRWHQRLPDAPDVRTVAACHRPCHGVRGDPQRASSQTPHKSRARRPRPPRPSIGRPAASRRAASVSVRTSAGVSSSRSGRRRRPVPRHGRCPGCAAVAADARAATGADSVSRSRAGGAPGARRAAAGRPRRSMPDCAAAGAMLSLVPRRPGARRRERARHARRGTRRREADGRRARPRHERQRSAPTAAAERAARQRAHASGRAQRPRRGQPPGERARRAAAPGPTAPAAGATRPS